MAVLVSAPPCVLHEDQHILVVHKPAGVNTHSPAPFAGEGIYEWLKNREPRWADLAIIHRLDKSTSGVMVFAKTKLGNRALTDQFAKRAVEKCYLLLTERRPAKTSFTVRTGIVRVGEKYQVSSTNDPANFAETRFESVGKLHGYFVLTAKPVTGRTHQIRVHAGHSKIPILGDEAYGGKPFARVCLHARELRFQHPDGGKAMTFVAEENFLADPAVQLRRGIIEPKATNAYRVVNGAADGWPGWYLEKWGNCLLAQSAEEIRPGDLKRLEAVAAEIGCVGVYRKTLNRDVRKTTLEEAAPEYLFGTPAPESFPIEENCVRYEASFQQGYSVGLFLDQRENRRRLLTNYIAAEFELFPNGLSGKEVLNTFAYTCGFSVCAALAGARTTSLDLSKKYLDWGRRNFAVNGLKAQEHDFIFGDVFDWAARFGKKGRQFDLILLDPPTFSHAKSGSVFQAERHYGRLVAAVLPLLRKDGILFASTNAHKVGPEDFMRQIERAIQQIKRRVTQSHYAPQPLDFPIHKEEPAYLKTVWMHVN